MPPAKKRYKPKKPKTKPKYTEDDLQSAIKDHIARGFTKRQAALNWGIPFSTLSDRIDKGAVDRVSAHERQQRLPTDVELELAAWIRDQDAQGVQPTHKQIYDLALHYLRANGDERPLGNKWVNAFLRRRNMPSVRKASCTGVVAT